MNLSEATRYVPQAVATRAVFSIDSDVYTWADVFRASEARGSWPELLASVRAGVVADAHATATGAIPIADELEAAATRFRYDRDLLAGDDLVSWLAHWAVSVADWDAYLRRALLSDRFRGDIDASQTSADPGDGSIMELAWTDAVCSRFVERAAAQFAADAALALTNGEVRPGRTTADFQRIHAAADAARSEALTQESLSREVANYRLEWTGVRAWLLELPDEDMAKEAAMCVRTDGSSLADVARDCGLAAVEVYRLQCDIEDDLAPQTFAAREGDLIGPLRLGESWVLVAIVGKTPPTLDDPMVRQRARDRIISNVEARAISRCVTWRESF